MIVRKFKAVTFLFTFFFIVDSFLTRNLVELIDQSRDRDQYSLRKTKKILSVWISSWNRLSVPVARPQQQQSVKMNANSVETIVINEGNIKHA